MRRVSRATTGEAGRMIADAHQRFYDFPDVVRDFKELTTLSPGEAAILAMLQTQIKDQPILDVGIGAGRTTPYLRELSANYVGIDLSKRMIESAREKFPDATLLEGDAADLSRFRSGEFAAVFFLGAGIDEAKARHRIRILQETYRVLRPGGIVVLCVHNLRAREASPWSDFKLLRSSNPGLSIANNIRSLPACCATAFKLLWIKATKRECSFLTEYEDYEGRRLGEWLPTYYICCCARVRQLQEVGFSKVEARDRHGHPTDGNARADNFLYYLAYKERKALQEDKAA
jgi:ubiquinone/menaquinone biosynthesis C-methylase UbiE